jgi:hypothetical protein
VGTEETAVARLPVDGILKAISAAQRGNRAGLPMGDWRVSQGRDCMFAASVVMVAVSSCGDHLHSGNINALHGGRFESLTMWL